MKHVFLFTLFLGMLCAMGHASQAQSRNNKHGPPDMNGDGAVSVLEAIKSQERTFRHLDDNGNGRLSIAEVKRHADEFPSAPEEWNVRQSFKAIDTNKDHALNEMEYLEGVVRGFRKSDRNCDYFITTDEMPR